MNELALFAGAGGGILAGKLLGWRTICAVEIEPYPISLLIQRQNEGILPSFPIWDDICTFDTKPWKSVTDIISGGFPCQPFSTATHGQPTAIDLWPQMRRVVNEIRPNLVFGENVSTKAIARAAKELQCDGYVSEVVDLSSQDVGADHQGHRSWFLAAKADLCSEFFSAFNVQARELPKLHSGVWSSPPEGRGPAFSVADADQRHRASSFEKSKRRRETRQMVGSVAVRDKSTSTPESSGFRMDDGMAEWMDRYFVIGNGQVPIVATTAFLLLANKLGEHFNEKPM